MNASTRLPRANGSNGDQLPAPMVAKTMAVIEAIGQQANGLTYAEIMESTGCSSNLVHRVLTKLVLLGYMNRRGDDRRYMITNRLAEVSRPRIVDKSLVVCAQVGLRWL